MYYCSQCMNYVSISPGSCNNCRKALTPFKERQRSGSSASSGQPSKSMAMVLARTSPQSMPPPSFSVNLGSLRNDLVTRSSDFSAQCIAVEFDLFGLGSEIRYVGNPTATPIGDAILPPRGGNPEHSLAPRFALPPGNTEVMFVVTREGKLILGTRPHDVRRPHPTLVGESDPSILTGGTITMKDGLIYEVRDDSGHHMPSFSGVDALLKAFSTLPQSLYHPRFQGFKPFGAAPIRPDFTIATLRNERICIQRELRLRAQTTVAKLTERIRTNQQTVGNPRATGGYPKILERHAGLVEEALELLGDLIFFAARYVRDLNQGLADQGIFAARSVIRQLNSTRMVDVTDSNTMRVAILAHNAIFTEVNRVLNAFIQTPDMA